jgi:glycosyltransferase involved in cell wall biosynthesis
VPIAFDSFGAVHDIIADGHNGVIVPNNNIAAYAKALLALMRNDAKRTQMAKCALESSRQFTLDKVTRQWVETFHKLCNNNHS